VFTGVSGSGKSSLVFGTIAAESQRLINETYSAFVQGFMPTLGRPDVDLLGADDRDHRRPGAHGRQLPLDGRHGHRRQRDAAHAVQPPRQAARRLAQRLLVQRPSVSGAGSITVEKGGGERSREAHLLITGGMCPRCEGMGSVTTSTSRSSTTTPSRSTRARSRSPATAWTAGTAASSRLRLLRPGQADPQVHQEGAHDLLYKEPTKIKVDGINLTYEG
jgi:hypothetical protein